MSEFKEIDLPDRSTWEAGLQQGVQLAENFITVYETEKKVLTMDPDVRGLGVPTTEEVKLSVALLVSKRMVIEAQADLLHNSIAVSRAVKFIMSHPMIPKPEKMSTVKALAIKEGCGIKLAQGWRILEQGLKKWQNKDYWINKQPEVEARKLLLAALGLQEVPVGNKDKEEDRTQSGGRNEQGLQESSGGQRSGSEALEGGAPQDRGGEREPTGGDGRCEGRSPGEDSGVQGVQEASGSQDQEAPGSA